MTYQMKIAEERDEAKNEERTSTDLDMLRENEPIEKSSNTFTCQKNV